MDYSRIAFRIEINFIWFSWDFNLASNKTNLILFFSAIPGKYHCKCCMGEPHVKYLINGWTLVIILGLSNFCCREIHVKTHEFFIIVVTKLFNALSMWNILLVLDTEYTYTLQLLLSCCCGYWTLMIVQNTKKKIHYSLIPQIDLSSYLLK